MQVLWGAEWCCGGAGVLNVGGIIRFMLKLLISVYKFEHYIHDVSMSEIFAVKYLLQIV